MLLLSRSFSDADAGARYFLCACILSFLTSEITWMRQENENTIYFPYLKCQYGPLSLPWVL